MCWRTWIPVVAAGVAAWTTLSAQQPAQQDATQEPAAAFRADVNFVEVPTIVTDEDDNFVEGLTIDDFTVLEDGELQTITVFEMIDLPTERPFTPIYADAPAEPDVHMARPSLEGRLYVLLLDDLHTAVLRTKEVQLEARRFVRENLYDGDIAAVAFTSGRAEGQELTTRRSLLLDALGRFEGLKLPSQSGELLGMHLGEQYETDMLFDLRDDPGEPRNRPVTPGHGAQRRVRHGARTECPPAARDGRARRSVDGRPPRTAQGAGAIHRRLRLRTFTRRSPGRRPA